MESPKFGETLRLLRKKKKSELNETMSLEKARSAQEVAQKMNVLQSELAVIERSWARETNNAEPRSFRWIQTRDTMVVSEDEAALKHLRELLQGDHDGRKEALYGRDPRDRRGWCLLHTAVACGSILCLRELLNQRNSPYELCDLTGRSPLELAYWFNCRRAIKILKRHKKRMRDRLPIVRVRKKLQAMMCFNKAGFLRKMRRKAAEREAFQARRDSLLSGNTTRRPKFVLPTVGNGPKNTAAVDQLRRKLTKIAVITGEVLPKSTLKDIDDDSTSLQSLSSFQSLPTLSSMGSSMTTKSAASTLDNWYSRRKGDIESKRDHRRFGVDSLYGIVEEGKHEQINLGKKAVWVNIQRHRTGD